ncbi:MAG: hypothetical protein ACK5LT_14035 [Lachnospirales bacterium]
MGIFSSIKTIFKKKKSEIVETPSVFEEYIVEIEKDLINVDVFKESAEICEELLRLEKQKAILKDKSKLALEEIDGTHSLLKLTDDSIAEFKNLLSRYTNVIKERNVLRYQLEGYDTVLHHLLKLEAEAIDACPKIINAEREKSIFRHDLAHLSNEKEDLVEEKKVLEFALKFLKIFNIVLVCAFAFMAMLLGYISIFKSGNIFWPTSISSIIIMFFITFAYVLSAKIKRDLKMNIKKQKKAVALINKKSVVFAYHTNFLNYTYKKYKISSGRQLQILLEDLKNYKKLMARSRTLRRIINDTELDIEKFLRSYKIKNDKITLLEFVETINIDKKKESFDNLLRDSKVFTDTIENLEEKQSILFEKLHSLRDIDDATKAIITEMKVIYESEVQKMRIEVSKDVHRDPREA